MPSRQAVSGSNIQVSHETLSLDFLAKITLHILCEVLTHDSEPFHAALSGAFLNAVRRERFAAQVRWDLLN